jgi:ectoine hydroxylase-related dioxygenase (phytanoyl-CoA dioxygenase family)
MVYPSEGFVHGWTAEKASLDLIGYSAPLPLAEPERASAVLEKYDFGGPAYQKNPHATMESVRTLVNDPGLLAAVRVLCGFNFRLWRSAFFSKQSGSHEIGWHHDKHFYTAEDSDIRLDEIGSHYSVLFGLSEISQLTGLLEVLPGSHRAIDGIDRDTRARHLRPADEHIIPDLPAKLKAGVRAVPIPAGSFLIFHSALLHRSLEHRGGPRRLGLAIRLVSEGHAIPDALVEAKDVFEFPPG